jgi:pimeloyl-ACP methyl ester carboxylesterase
MSVLAGAGLCACGSPAAAPGSTTRPSAVVTGAIYPAMRWSAPGPSTIPTFYDPPDPLPPAAAGTLIRAQIVTGVPGMPAGATLWRILYHSRSVTGADIAVSGYVVVPDRKAPAGGYPVIAWAHGTTGVARTCAPSLFSEAADSSGIYLAPDLSAYVGAGYLVAATDYQGLGGPGVHPYLVGQSEGQNVLDAAIAAAQLPGVRASKTTVIVGHSQGGQAALFAGQLAPTYASGLHVVGTVAIAPLTQTQSALPLAAALGELSLLASAAYAWANTYSDMPMTSLFVTKEIDRITSLENAGCLGEVDNALAGVPVSSVMRQGFASLPALVAHLRQNSPGLVHTDSPILVLQGTLDTTIPDLLAQTFVGTQCPAVHDDVELRLYPGATHTSVLVASGKDMIAWIAARLAGEPVSPGCSTTTVAAGG